MDAQAFWTETPPYCYCRHKPPCYTQPNIVPCYSNFPMIAPPWIPAPPPPTESFYAPTPSTFPATQNLTVHTTATSFTSFSFTPVSQMKLKEPTSNTPKNKFRYHPLASTSSSRRESFTSILEQECMVLEQLTAIADRYIPVEPVKQQQQRTSIHWRIIPPASTTKIDTDTTTNDVLSMMSQMKISPKTETPKKS
uniref:Uncharacterized protein n=1 Tax=Panagrolaimus davidi TaxID=227884 RepID=A0A914QQN4_9BILA